MSTAATQLRKRAPAARPARFASFPLLETGYHLSQPDFHRRYERMPDLRRAELIEGIVFMGPPLSIAHADATAHVLAWLVTYCSETPGVTSGSGASVILDSDNEYQPDAHLLIDPQRGGQTALYEGRYVKGAPEMVVEVSVSSLTHDLHEKLAVYRRNGVREYLVWSLPEARIHWFNFAAGEDVRLRVDRRGRLCSRCFPGLWLHEAALLKSDIKRVLATVRRGVASAGHAAFVRKLSTTRSR